MMRDAKGAQAAMVPFAMRPLAVFVPLLLTLAAKAAPAAPMGDAAFTSRICEEVQVEAGSKLVFHAFAEGYQVYRWTGTAWLFVQPEAVLYADAGGNGTIGIHYAGPTWQSVSGGKVVGAVVERCTADPGSIQWLLLAATPDDGPGIFQRVRWIQRVNTVGGLAPAGPGAVIGEEARVPYAAEYLFWR